MRRAGLAGVGGVGIAGIHRQEQVAQRSAQLGEQVAADRAAHIKEQVDMFRKRLEEFAVKYRAEINKDPQFRHHFVRMAKSIGVDPLASSKQGFLAETLGLGLGGFYADLAVQVAHVCMATRPTNGGLISMPALVSRVNAMRGSLAGGVNDEDVRRALGKLSTLQGGYTEVSLGGGTFISSVPELLNSDTAAAITMVGTAPGGFLTVQSLVRGGGWQADRAERTLHRLLRDGLAWLDRAPPSPGGAGSEDRYYFPSLSLGAPR